MKQNQFSYQSNEYKRKGKVWSIEVNMEKENNGYVVFILNIHGSASLRVKGVAPNAPPLSKAGIWTDI